MKATITDVWGKTTTTLPDIGRIGLESEKIIAIWDGAVGSEAGIQITTRGPCAITGNALTDGAAWRMVRLIDC